MTVEDVNIKYDNFCYNGNPKLKKAGVTIPYAKQQIEEYIKCRDNIIHFVKTYVKIVSLDEGLVTFNLYPYQERMINSCHENRYSIFLTGRQMGKTTTIAAYLLYEAIFKRDIRIAIVANKGDTAREILSRIKKMFEELPWFLKPGVIEWNKGSIELSNGTKVISAATSSSSIRGQSINCVYMDELAFIQNDVEFFASTYPVITSGKSTKVIVTSTPNGMNLFYKLWTDAEYGRNSFVPSKYLWHHHPNRDEKWKFETLRNISQQQFNQEFECHFLGSALTLISGSKLQKLAFVDPIKSDEYFSVYEEPEKDHLYAAGVDFSEGCGRDYSVISIFDVTSTPFKQVAVYRNNTIPPIMFVDVIHKILLQYNEAYCVIESNGIGSTIANSLYYDLEYENMLITKETKGEAGVSTVSGKVGLYQSRKTKLVGCSALKSMIESDTLIVQDFMTVQELSTFVRTNQTYQAEERKTDDIVMTLVMFAWFTVQPYFESLMDINIRKKIQENYLKSEETTHLIFGFYDDGIEEEDPLADAKMLKT